MKKSKLRSFAVKAAVCLGGLAGLSAAANWMIFTLAGAKKREKRTTHVYTWRYGQVRYTTAGKGRPLLLVHGLGIGAGLHEWDRNFDVLSRYYQVYALDLSGFGYSDKPGISYSSYLYITLINDFIRDVIGDSVYIAASGLSGAYAVMAYSFRPELYKKMLLISPDTGSGADSSEGFPIGKLLEFPIVGDSIYNGMASRFSIRRFLAERAFGDQIRVTKEMVDQYYYSAHFGGADGKYPVMALLSGHLSVSFAHKLSDVQIPIHVVWGDCNATAPVEGWDQMEEYNSFMDLTVFEGCKLLPHVENPKAFLKVCRKFFGRETQ